ncbi:hypothetical protein IG631_10519 [Alternaria alternata]|jgi:hypothetical protein|nr:hypothetical protein IG631_10519 [Alternaria alternata]
MLASAAIHPEPVSFVSVYAREVSASLKSIVPETSLRTFWEISAATLYLVIVSGFAKV